MRLIALILILTLLSCTKETIPLSSTKPLHKMVIRHNAGMVAYEFKNNTDNRYYYDTVYTNPIIQEFDNSDTAVLLAWLYKGSRNLSYEMFIVSPSGDTFDRKKGSSGFSTQKNFIIWTNQY